MTLTTPPAEAELAWLTEVIATRLRAFFAGAAVDLPQPPDLPPQSQFAQIAPSDIESRVVLALALARIAAPSVLDPFLVENGTLKRSFTEFGGISAMDQPGFVPTGETALFLLAGTDMAARTKAIQGLMAPDGIIARKQVTLEGASGTPPFARRLHIQVDLATRILTERHLPPDFSAEFPAQRLTTNLNWDDVVLGAHTLEEIRHVEAWLTHEDRILTDWGLGRTLAPGYRVLFYGPPGTGKTLTATLLGKMTEREVYRIDLSMVVSKYIGETEKNLSTVFDQAASGRWILFFDEADALFGKRTQTSSANDRYANQEVSYLLQRIETNPGLTILATNLRGNIDAAFSRRFQSLIPFTRPDVSERRRLWAGILHGSVPLDVDVDLDAVAAEYDLTGGAIVNAVRFAAVAALKAGRNAISRQDIADGVAAELRKDGSTA